MRANYRPDETTQVRLTSGEIDGVMQIRCEMEKKYEKLRNFNPVILDLSIREPSVGAATGHLVEHKHTLFKLAREMGFQDILLATFNVFEPDEPQTDDIFCQELYEQGTDLSGCFAFTGLGEYKADEFTPGSDLKKLKKFCIPNTIIDIDLASKWIGTGNASRQQFKLSLIHTIKWINDNITGENGGHPRIYINYRDLPDAYAEDWHWLAEVTKLLGTQAISAVTFEDPKGTLFPFQIGGITAMLRRLIPEDMLILVHIHTGNGMENAGVIEAILAGADGVWSGLAKEAAYIGHASTAEFLANLMRFNNAHIERFNLENMTRIVHDMTRINLDEDIARDMPIFGERAYTSMLSVFEQREAWMDLAPERIGQRYRYRIAPVASDADVIKQSLQAVIGDNSPTHNLDNVIKTMRRLIRRDLIDGRRIAYEVPENLKKLYQRACAASESNEKN